MLLALIGLELAGVVARPYWLIPAVANLVVAARARQFTRPMLDAADDVATAAASYAAVFAVLGRQQWTSERLAALRDALFAPATAELAVRRLARVGEWAAVPGVADAAWSIASRRPLGLPRGARARRLAPRQRARRRRMVCRARRDRVSGGVRRIGGGEPRFRVSSCRGE
jgi:hypothetical protein